MWAFAIGRVILSFLNVIVSCMAVPFLFYSVILTEYGGFVNGIPKSGLGGVYGRRLKRSRGRAKLTNMGVDGIITVYKYMLFPYLFREIYMNRHTSLLC